MKNIFTKYIVPYQKLTFKITCQEDIFESILVADTYKGNKTTNERSRWDYYFRGEIDTNQKTFRIARNTFHTTLQYVHEYRGSYYVSNNTIVCEIVATLSLWQITFFSVTGLGFIGFVAVTVRNFRAILIFIAFLYAMLLYYFQRDINIFRRDFKRVFNEINISIDTI